MTGNIRVFCRIRPIRLGESFGRLRPAVASQSSDVILKIDDKKSKNYSFDKVFHPGSSQDEVFSEVEPVIKSVLDGYNACIFAYGQTGTGKTFTMEGTPDSPGIVPRAIEALFKQVEESNHAFLISFSMLEIYLGNLKDLLVTHPTKAMDPLPPRLSIKTDPKGGIEIDNLVAIPVSDFNQALRLYRLGCRFRSTASTNSNATSSRSHRPAPSFEEHLQVSQSSTEEALSNLKAKNKTGDSVAAPLSQIPRFMRPTASSRRKSGMDPHISDGKDQVLGRRRRPPSHRAESVTFPMKNNSEYNSDRSISRSSCLAGLNLKASVDNETEYSQETLDYDTKMVVSSQQYTLQRTLIHQKAPLNYLEKTGNQKTEKVNITKFSKVDDWLSHKNEPTIRGYIHSKRALAIPIPKKKKKREGPSKKEKFHGDKVPAYEFTKEDIIGRSTAEKQFDAGRAEMPVLVEINDKPQMMLKELFEQDSTFNSTSPSHESGGQTITEMQDSIGGWSTEEDSSGSLSPLDMCCDRLDQHEDEDEVYIMSIMPEVKSETQCSDSKAKNGECSDMCCGRLDQCEDEDEFYTISIMPEVKGETKSSDSMVKTGECSDMCYGRLDQHEDEDKVSIMSIMPEVKGETQCSDNMVKKGECSFSESDLVNIVTNQKGDSGVSISKFELESLCQQVPTGKYIEDNEKEDLDGFSQPSALVTRTGPLKLRSKRALFMENANHNDLITPDVRTEGRTKNEGICCAIKEKFQIVSASALLGSGLHDLGFDHEFFHGLTF